MPITPTYPGVYIQELSSGVHAISGVSTSVAAFLGVASQGTPDVPAHIFSFSDYERQFGGLVDYSDMSYAVREFFLNGGNEAWVVRLVSSNTTQASWTARDVADQKDVLIVTALNPGKTGNDIEVQVDYQTKDPANTFNLTVIYAPQNQPTAGQTEVFQDLSMDPANAQFVETVVNNGSQLVKATVPAAIQKATDFAAVRPRPTPTSGTLLSGTFGPNDLDSIPDDNQNSFMIQLGSYGPDRVTLKATDVTGTGLAAKLASLATAIQNAVQQLKKQNVAYKGFTCTVSGTNALLLTSGARGDPSSVTVTPDSTKDIAASLHLLTTGTNAATATAARKIMLKNGQEGPFDPTEVYNLFIGDPLKHEGIYALDTVDLFNLLCLPGITDSGILSDAAVYCQKRRAFLIADAPKGKTADEMLTYVQSINPVNEPVTSYAALYYPWVAVPDPLNNGNLKTIPPTGIMAGIYARTDTARGVWKAPAGTETSFADALGLERLLTDDENGFLNPNKVNCIRAFPGYGLVPWGARTLTTPSDTDYRYVPVRRLALYIEESLFRGLKWVVFEPNDEPLWAQIRLNVGAFMQTLFRQGAFQGQTPTDAYFVKCDKETTPPDDVNLGIVNIAVGFAPLKPAEFVIITIQQMAGQVQS